MSCVRQNITSSFSARKLVLQPRKSVIFLMFDDCARYAFLYIECFDVVVFDWKQEGVLSYWTRFPFNPKENYYTLWASCDDRDKDAICSFPDMKPTVFLLFFIGGDAINELTSYGWIKKPLKFKNPYAFYPVYIPYQ